MMDAQVEGRRVIEEDARDPERAERFLDALASMIAEAISGSRARTECGTMKANKSSIEGKRKAPGSNRAHAG